MPYVNKGRKDALFNDNLDDFNDNRENSGELNYMITTYLIEYVQRHGLCYQTLNDISGAMTECLAEFRRRVIVPYEIKKIKQNGDVYPKRFK